MIQIEVQPHRITICGHAGYSTYGMDTICASISTLVQGFILSIEKLTEDSIQYELNPGKAVIYHMEFSEKGDLLLQAFLCSILMVKEVFPKYVDIHIVSPDVEDVKSYE